MATNVEGAGTTAGDCAEPLVAGESNNFGVSTNCTITVEPLAQPVIPGDPHLGPLQDNGGPTFTHAPSPGSLALRAGNCQTGTVGADQRGYPRPVAAPCDLGAFQASSLNRHDFDGDGRAAILWRDTQSGQAGMWLMNGLSIMPSQMLFIPGASPWEIAGTGGFGPVLCMDCNEPSTAGVFWRNTQTGDNGVWLMNGFSILAAQGLPGAGSTWLVR